MKNENNRQKKDVLIINQFFYPEYVTTAKLSYELAEYLSKKGYKVGALCGYPYEYTDSEKGNVPLRETVNGIDIRRVKYISKKRVGTLARILNYFSFCFSVWTNLHVAKEYKAIIVTTSPPILPFFAALARRRYKNKLILVAYDIYPEIAYAGGYTGKGGLMSKGLAMANRFSFRYTDKTIAMSKDMKRFLAENRNTEGEKIDVIPSWYADKGALPHIDRKSTKLFSDYDNDDLIVSYFGNMGECQDMDTIFDAIKKLADEPKIRFVFAGHGTKAEKCRRIAEEEKLTNVRVLPFLHGDEYAQALCVSDVFVVSLIKGLEGLCAPSKTYTYLMAGRPIIAVMDDGMEICTDDINGSHCGKVFENGDADGIADYIRYLRSSPSERETLGKNGREVYLRKYEKEKCLSEYEKSIRDTAGCDVTTAGQDD